MDTILLFLLIGILLAVTKRFYSALFRNEKNDQSETLRPAHPDRIMAYFPGSLFSGKFTSGTNGAGSYLTYNAGNFFAQYLPVEHLSYAAWWTYSSLLGLFFLLLPFSRYMHIPTEMVYIFLKNWGIKQGRNTTVSVKYKSTPVPGAEYVSMLVS